MGLTHCLGVRSLDPQDRREFLSLIEDVVEGEEDMTEPAADRVVDGPSQVAVDDAGPKIRCMAKVLGSTTVPGEACLHLGVADSCAT